MSGRARGVLTMIKKQHEMAYLGGGGPLPLGARCGVPDRAATVDTAGVLDGYDSELAEIVRDPWCLLLPECE